MEQKPEVFPPGNASSWWIPPPAYTPLDLSTHHTDKLNFKVGRERERERERKAGSDFFGMVGSEFRILKKYIERK